MDEVIFLKEAKEIPNLGRSLITAFPLLNSALFMLKHLTRFNML